MPSKLKTMQIYVETKTKTKPPSVREKDKGKKRETARWLAKLSISTH